MTNYLMTFKMWYWRKDFQSLSRRVVNTKPIACSTTTSVEVHTLTGARGVYIYLAAIKSLLRYCQDVAVIVHDDGSLTQRHRRLLCEHVPGLHIITKAEADSRMGHLLKDFPMCRHYRDRCPMGMQLLDYALLSNARRIVSLDSDTLFLSNPVEFLDWITSSCSDVLYSVEESPWDPTGLIKRLGGLGNLNAGFLCLSRSIIKPEKIELILKGESEFSWWTGQCCFNILCKPTPWIHVQALNPADYQNLKSISDGAVFRHYFGSGGAHKLYYCDLYSVIKKLEFV